MEERTAIDRHHVRRSCLQRHQGRHYFREAGRWKPAGRILFQQNAAGLEIHHVQGGCLDRRPGRQVLGPDVDATEHDCHTHADDERTSAPDCAHGATYRPNSFFIMSLALSVSDRSSAGGAGSGVAGASSGGLFIPGLAGLFIPGWPMPSRPIAPPIMPPISNFVYPWGISNNCGSCLPIFTFLSSVIIRCFSFPSLYRRSVLMEMPSFVRQEKPPYFFPSELVAMVLYLVTFIP